MDWARQTGREGAATAASTASAAAAGRSRTRVPPASAAAASAAHATSRSTSGGRSQERTASATGMPTHTAARAAASAAAAAAAQATASTAATAVQPKAHATRPASAVRTQRSPLRHALAAPSAAAPSAAVAASLDAFAARSAAVSAEEKATLMGAWTHSRSNSRDRSPNASSAMHSGRNSPRAAATANGATGADVHAAPFLADASTSDPAALTAASASLLGTTLVPTGSARISDLDPAEKGKIGSLLREVVTLQRSRAQLEQSKHEMEREMRSLAQRSAISEQEAAELRVQCQRGIDMLAEYQSRMHGTATAAPAPSAPQFQPPQQPFSVQQQQHPSHSDNPNISRLQELSERARVAASGMPSFSPAYAATPAAHPSGSRSALSTPALNSASRLPHAQLPTTMMMTRYVPSASAAATSPYQPPPEPATAAPSNASVAAGLSQQRQSRPPSPPPQPYVSAAQQQIDREYVAALVDAKEQLGALSHSLETQRKLDLSDEQRVAGSRRHSRDPSPHSASRSVSPPMARAVAVVSAPAAAAPSSVSILPAAVSGVTRTLALSSPESLEKRAIALANTMFERKMAEQAETERRNRQLEEREQSLRIPAPAPAPTLAPAAASTAQSHAPAQPDRRTSSKPAGSSLSSFFHSHPLTSALSPLAKQRNQPSQPQQQQQQPPHQGDEHKEESKHQPPPSSTAAASTDSESDFVSHMLSKSMRLAQSYAEERERRARSTAAAAAAPAAAVSSRTFTRPSETQLSAAPFDPASFSSSSFAASSSIPRSAAAFSSATRTLSQDPSSPYSAVLPSSQLALLTPTSRKIHRLISIQNPLHPQLQAAAEAADREEREFAAKEASKLQEMAHKLEERRREVAKAEAMVQTKRERERAVAAAAITSPFGVSRPPPPQAQAQVPVISAVERAKHPTARARTPVETYVPPPFSFRPSSRAASAQQQTARPSEARVYEASVAQSEDDDEDDDRVNESSTTHFDAVRTPAAGAGLFPPRSTHTTPGTALSTPGSIGSMQQHAAGHTSFISPAPSSRPSTHARRHPRHDVASVAAADDVHAEADAEVWDVFHLRSPSNLQSKDAPTASAAAAVASRSVSVATTPSLAARQEAAARNFGLSMLQSSAQNQQRAALQSSMEHYRAVADASTTFSPAAVHQALTTPAPPRAPLVLSSASAAPVASAPTAAAAAPSSWRMPASSPSRMQVRLESLHMAQLERELDELVPHVLEELAMQRERAETPVETPPAQPAKQRSDEDEQRDRRIARMAREVEAHSKARAATHAEPEAYPSARDVHSRLAKQQQAMEEESKHNTEQAQRVLLQAQEARARSIGTNYSPARMAGTALRARPNDFDASLLDVIDQMGDE